MPRVFGYYSSHLKPSSLRPTTTTGHLSLELTDAVERKVGIRHHVLFRYERGSRKDTDNTRWVCLYTNQSAFAAFAALTDTFLTRVQPVS